VGPARRLAARLVAGPLLAAGILHPLHTTITTVDYDAAAHVATATIRIFADDLARAVHQSPGLSQVHVVDGSADTAAVGYIRRKFIIETTDGRSVSLTPCGIRSTGDLRWVCLRASLPHGLSAVRIGDMVLTDIYTDQINVVMMTDGAHHGSLLFTRGDGAKPAGV
jgi:hypothetical protein